MPVVIYNTNPNPKNIKPEYVLPLPNEVHLFPYQSLSGLSFITWFTKNNGNGKWVTEKPRILAYKKLYEIRRKGTELADIITYAKPEEIVELAPPRYRRLINFIYIEAKRSHSYSRSYSKIILGKYSRKEYLGFITDTVRLPISGNLAITIHKLKFENEPEFRFVFGCIGKLVLYHHINSLVQKEYSIVLYSSAIFYNDNHYGIIGKKTVDYYLAKILYDDAKLYSIMTDYSNSTSKVEQLTTLEKGWHLIKVEEWW